MSAIVPTETSDPAGLEKLISDRLVRTVFQPIADLSRGEVAGFECLTRPDPGSGFADATRLFDAAQAQGRLIELDAITRGKALQAAGDWPPGSLLFLNTTPQTFARADFAELLLEEVHGCRDLTPGQIVLEITEREESDDVLRLREQVELVKQLGFGIALDDVGAGTNGLCRMMTLRPHWLKLDRALVSGIHQDRVKQNLVRLLAHFGETSGVKVVAEGIERAEELSTVIDLGVPFAQGYYLGRPGPREGSLVQDRSDWLKARWREAEAARPARPEQARVTSVMRGVLTLSARTGVDEAARELLKRPARVGLAAVEGDRFVGWCTRGDVLHAAGSAESAQRLGFLMERDSPSVGVDATVAEALEVAASKHCSPGTPLVVCEEGRPVGIVLLRDLLREAASIASRSEAARRAA